MKYRWHLCKSIIIQLHLTCISYGNVCAAVRTGSEARMGTVDCGAVTHGKRYWCLHQKMGTALLSIGFAPTGEAFSRTIPTCIHALPKNA